MIETVFIGSAFSIAVFFVWLVASYNEGRKAQAKIQETQRQLKMSEDRSSHLRVEMSKLKDEMSYLHKNIDQEQRSKTSALTEMQRMHQVKMFKRQILGGCAGFVVGTLAMGMWFNAQAKIQVLEQLRDVQVEARVSEVKLEIIKEQKKILEEKNFQMEKELINLRETRAVSLTKLEMLLGHLATSSQKMEMIGDVQGPSQIPAFNSTYSVNANSFSDNMAIPAAPTV
jgi:cell division protein FtsB